MKILNAYQCCIISGLVFIQALFTLHAQNTARIVEVTEVQKGSVIKSIKLPGIIKAGHEYNITVEIDGYLDKLDTKTGGHVKKGDLIATIRNTKLMDKYISILKLAQSAEASYNQIKQSQYMDHADIKKIEKNKQKWINISMKLQDIEKELEKTQLHMPYDGIIKSFLLNIGDEVGKGDKVAIAYDLSSYIIEFNIPYFFVNNIKKGQLVQFDKNKGIIETIDTVLDGKNKSKVAQARFSNCLSCELDKVVDIYLVVEEKHDILVLPREATFIQDDKHCVYVIRENKAYMQTIEVGLEGDKNVEIKQGLKIDDVVVLHDQFQLYHSIPIIVKH